MIGSWKRAVLGRPLPTSASEDERLSRPAALAAFGLDALSSVAYAPQEILLVLVLAGPAGLGWVLPVAAAIVVLMAIVATSYRQTIYAYPGGGGSYVVARENLDTRWGLVAAGALTVDYLLVVAVSVSAGVAELGSAFPALVPYRVPLGVALIAIMVLVNLRGVREAGAAWAVPTYVFIAALGSLVLLGLARWLLGWGGGLPPSPHAEIPPPTEALGLALLLRAFAGGCTAMTGIEAIANGVPLFRPPESRNAAATLVALTIVLAVLFLGIAALAGQIGVVPTEEATVISQVSESVFARSAPYYVVQLATTVVLILAANTSFNGFPVLAAALARDGYMPRQLANRGDRLGYSNGILILGFAAALLLIGFGGDTHALIPLFAVGVFVSFTLSQVGMARRWLQARSPGWRHKATINAIGGTATLVATFVILEAKLLDGAWIVCLILVVLVWAFSRVRGHYDEASRELTVAPADLPAPSPPKHVVLVPVARLDRAVVATVSYALSLSDHVVAVHVTDDLVAATSLQNEWLDWGVRVPLVVLESRYRHLVGNLVEYAEFVRAHYPDECLTVLLPEFVPRRWWQHALHNQTTLALKAALLFHPGIVVTSVPFHLQR
jgi:amino acid transporter